MPILSIDTSTRGCSVAVHENDKLLSISELFHEKSSSGMLTTLIEHCIKTSNLSFQDLNAIAIAKGPGSYTGLRIGVSTVKGLCYTLEKPMISVNTLEAMACQVNDFVKKISFQSLNPSFPLLCPMLDARRMEVYCAVYEAVTKKEINATQAKIIDENSFAELLEKHQIIFFGEGAEKCKAILGNNKNAIFLENYIYPSAKTIGLLAFEKFEKQQFENVADFEPYYLKEFMATMPKKVVF
jgi:tRNA threonylcarbamoyladenosine biosynthesis protein TsaB